MSPSFSSQSYLLKCLPLLAYFHPTRDQPPHNYPNGHLGGSNLIQICQPILIYPIKIDASLGKLPRKVCDCVTFSWYTKTVCASRIIMPIECIRHITSPGYLIHVLSPSIFLHPSHPHIRDFFWAKITDASLSLKPYNNPKGFLG